jgi:hypothetical protein
MRATILVLAVMMWLALPAHASAAGMTGATCVVASGGSRGLPGPAKHLTAKHAGWRQTACLGCHDAAALAGHKKPGLTPADCGPCHGYNGAPHEGHAIAINPCGNCHARVAHVSAFAAPDACIKCHVHPKSPQGR